MGKRLAVKILGLTIRMLLEVNPHKAIGGENDLIEQQLKFFRKEFTKSQLVHFMNEALVDLSELKEDEIPNGVSFEIMKIEI